MRDPRHRQEDREQAKQLRKKEVSPLVQEVEKAERNGKLRYGDHHVSADQQSSYTRLIMELSNEWNEIYFEQPAEKI